MASVKSRRARLLAAFSQEGFRGPVLTLLSGTGVAMAVALISQPILTRLYTPEEFGVLSYFTSLLGILVTLSSLQYDSAMMLPEDEGDAHNLFWLSLLMLACWAVLLSVLCIWREDIARILGIPAMATPLLLLPPALLGMRFGKLAETLLLRARSFRTVTAGQVTNACVTAAARIGAGTSPLSAGAFGLIGGAVAGFALSGAFYADVLRRRTGRELVRTFDLRRMRAMAVRYRRFSFLSTPSGLLNAVITRLPFLLIPIYFHQAEAQILGFLGLAFNMLSVPLTLVRGAVAQAFRVHAVESLRSGRIAEATRAVHDRLVMAGLFPTLAVMICGPDVFAFIFGSTWREAGVYAQFIAPWIFLAFVASPLTHVFDVLERQEADLLSSLAMMVTLTGALVLAGHTGDIRLLLLLLGVAGALTRMMHIATMLHLAQVKVGAALRPYGTYALRSIPFILVLFLSTLPQRPWLTTAAAAVTGTAYGWLMLRSERLIP